MSLCNPYVIVRDLSIKHIKYRPYTKSILCINHLVVLVCCILVIIKVYLGDLVVFQDFKKTFTLKDKVVCLVHRFMQSANLFSVNINFNEWSCLVLFGVIHHAIAKRELGGGHFDLIV